jgi:hypothetical protein
LTPACERELSAVQCAETCATYTKSLGFTTGGGQCLNSLSKAFIDRQCCTCDGGDGPSSEILHVNSTMEMYSAPKCADEPLYPLVSEYNPAYAQSAYGEVDTNWKVERRVQFYLLWNTFVKNPTGVNLVAPSLANKLLLTESQADTVNDNEEQYPYALSRHPDDDAKQAQLLDMTLRDVKVLRMNICNLDIEKPSDVIINIYTSRHENEDIHENEDRCESGEWFCSRHSYVAEKLYTKSDGCADVVVPLQGVNHPNVMSVADSKTTTGDFSKKKIQAIGLFTNTGATVMPKYTIKSLQLNDIQVTFT